MGHITDTTRPCPDTFGAKQKRWGQIAVWLLLLTLMVILGWKLQQVNKDPLVFGKAPDFTLTTFHGESYTLSDHIGQVVVINFWASWCGPCEVEAADLERAWNKYQSLGVLFLGVGYVDTETEALAYLRKWNVTYPNGHDLRTEISQAYRIRGVPETYIVDKHGILHRQIIGPANLDQLSIIIEHLLDE